MLIKVFGTFDYLQAAARWWNTNGLGNAVVYLHPLLSRLALPKYDAHLLVLLWSCICNCPCIGSFKNGFQGTLCDTLPSLCSPDVQVLHLHKRCICKAACKIIFGYHFHGKPLLAFWSPILQQHFSVVLQPRGTCFMACLDGVQFIFCKHFPDVLSCSAVGLESKSCPLHGIFPVCENSKTKNPVRGAAKQMASFPFHLVWRQIYGFGRLTNNSKHNSFLLHFLNRCKW